MKESWIWKGRYWTWTKNMSTRSEDDKQEHVNANQVETVITGFHSETTESEVIQLLKERINEIGMDFGSARIECPAKPITHAFIHFANDGERNKFIRSANMLKRELRGRKIRITRSMDAEERFYNKRMGICQILHPYETQHSSQPDLPELDCQNTCQSRERLW